MYGGTLFNCVLWATQRLTAEELYTVTLYNCTVIGNSAGNFGGGALCE